MIEDIKSVTGTQKDFKKFGITIAVFLILLGIVLYFIKQELNVILSSVGILFLLLGMFIPAILKPFYKIWMSIAIILNYIMTRLILSLLFYTVFTLISIILKITGKQFLDIKQTEEKESYWMYRNTDHNDKNIYERQF